MHPQPNDFAKIRLHPPPPGLASHRVSRCDPPGTKNKGREACCSGHHLTSTAMAVANEMDLEVAREEAGMDAGVIEYMVAMFRGGWSEGS